MAKKKVFLLLLISCLLLMKWQTVFASAIRNVAQINILWELQSSGTTERFRRAIHLLSNVSGIAPFQRTSRVLGYAYYYLEDINSAKKAWCLAKNMGPELIVNGNHSRFLGRFEESTIWYGLAVECGQNVLSSALTYQALTYLALNDQVEMSNTLIQATKYDSGWIDNQSKFLAWYYLGVYYSLNQQNVEAESAITTAITSLPKAIPQNNDLSITVVSEAYRVLGTAQWAQSKGKQALSNLQQAIALNDKNTWAHVHYGKVLYLLNSSSEEQTQKEFQRALALRPSDKMLWENLIGFWRWVKNSHRTKELCLLSEQKALHFPSLCNDTIVN